MLAELKQGMIVECLSCQQPIKLDNKTFLFNSEIEYIRCPKCNKCFDTIGYMLMGTEIKEGEVNE